MGKLSKLIELHEGRVEHAYQDSLGYWTIGVGHLIDKRRGGKLSQTVIDDLLEDDINDHYQQLFAACPWVVQLDEVRRAVLTDMCFNLGIAGLSKFVNTLKAVKEGRYSDAADGMLASKWASQVGNRAKRLATMMRTGKWPKEIENAS